jgi:hypothetical protein
MQALNLFTCHFVQGDKARQKELDFCLKTNQESGLFNTIINFSDRPTYNDFFKATENYPNDINIFTNADIYFNDTIKLVQGIKANECYALTRWELRDGEIISFEDAHEMNAEAKPQHSQDVWVFNGTAKNINGYFSIGQPGCDNRIAREITISGYNVTNPSDEIQCIHKHANPERNYTMGSIPGPYMWVYVGGNAGHPGQARQLIRRTRV